MFRRSVFALVALAVVGVTAFAQDHEGLTATKRAEYRIGEPDRLPLEFAGFFAYNNSTGFSGSAAANGGSAVQSGNTITRMVMDDINLHPSGVGLDMSEWGWSVANLNTSAVSVRMRIRFWADNAGNPGTYLTGFTFNPVTVNAGSVAYYLATTANAMLLQSKFWAGITFDNNTGGTGATLAQMDNIGVGLYGDPTVGTSADDMFRTTAAGSFLGTNNPAGGHFNFGGSPKANGGWYFKAIPEPSSIAAIGAALMGLAGLKLRRR